ncbi:MAG: sigma-70 family RNA polymerase sigma factor [Verrucomicrobiales bacterium]|nr:sigma-70 family RNA polymerase sigma factor [Verrucomicrobiales bacterium]
MPTESFHTTHWTRVLAARGESSDAKLALSELCEAYYAPVHAFILHSVGKDLSRDLTHAFFASLLERDTLGNLKKGDGKFRSYLLGAVKHFLRDEWVRNAAAKRGGGERPISLDTGPPNTSSGGGLSVEQISASDPPGDAFFDRHWALAVLGRALDALADKQGSGAPFEALKPWLTGEPVDISQAEVAAKLRMSEGALKVAIHRLRRRLRENVKTEIAATLDSETEADMAAEMDYLIRALNY